MAIHGETGLMRLAWRLASIALCCGAWGDLGVDWQAETHFLQEPLSPRESWCVFQGQVWTNDAVSADGLNWLPRERVSDGKLVAGQNALYTILPGQLSISTDGRAFQYVAGMPFNGSPTAFYFKDTLWVIGGYPESRLFRLDEANSWLEATPPPWRARVRVTVGVFHGELYVVGGASELDGENDLNDVWKSSDGVSWQLVIEHAAWPAGSYRDLVEFNGALWLFGAGGLWRSEDGASWEEVILPEALARLSGLALVQFRDELCFFGGAEERTRPRNHSSGRRFFPEQPGYDCEVLVGLGDVWVSRDGVAWERRAGAPAWGPRTNMGLLSHGGWIWMLGGATYEGDKNDVWRSRTGRDWELVTEHAPWAPRRGAAVTVHDGAMWLVGGIQGDASAPSPMIFNDVWTSSDGTTWTELVSAAPWTGAHGAGALSHNGFLYVIGGQHRPLEFEGYVEHGSEVWRTVDGSDWALQSADNDWGFDGYFGASVFQDKLFLAGSRACYADGPATEGPNLCSNHMSFYSSLDGAVWDKVRVSVPSYGVDVAAAPSLINIDERLVLLGGLYQMGLIYFSMDDEYESYASRVMMSTTGNTWTEAARRVFPERMAAGAVAHDGRIVLVGGEDKCTYLGDVWSSGEANFDHSADFNGDGVLNLDELLSVISFYNSAGYHCDTANDEGFAGGDGDRTCAPHSSDYAPQDWTISIDELLRAVQFYNSLGYYPCEGSEDGYCPGTFGGA